MVRLMLNLKLILSLSHYLEINAESQIDIILESLPNSFNQFKLNCSMNKTNFTLAEF